MAVAKLQDLSAPAVRGLGELKGCGQTWGGQGGGVQGEMTCSWVREFCRAYSFTLCYR